MSPYGLKWRLKEVRIMSATWIEAIATSISVLISTIAVLISVINLKQNSKMIEESTRPYITIFLDTIVINNQNSFFIIKNFGSCGAQITDFTYDKELLNNKRHNSTYNEQFNRIKGLYLAPGQRKLLFYDVTGLKSKVVTFKITYKGTGKSYSERVNINVKNYIDIAQIRADANNKESDNTQDRILQEIAERLI